MQPGESINVLEVALRGGLALLGLKLISMETCFIVQANHESPAQAHQGQMA